MHPPSVSLVIPVRNEAQHIRLTLDSILRQTYPLSDVEILVVDGMSTDGTQEVVREYASRLPQLWVLDNEGVITAAALNIGIRAARGEYIAIIGGHSEPSPNYLAACLDKLSQPGFGCVGGVLDTVSTTAVGKAIALAMSSPFGVGNAYYRYSRREMDVDTVAFGVYRKAIFDELGAFNEEITFSEDEELSFRITQSGHRIRLLPQVSVRYYARETYRELWHQYYNYGRGKVKVFKKHRRFLSWRSLVPPVFVLSQLLGILGGLFYRPVLALWVAVVVVYLTIGIFVALTITRWNVFETVAVFWAYVCLHISYGVGVLAGLAEWLFTILFPGKLE